MRHWKPVAALLATLALAAGILTSASAAETVSSQTGVASCTTNAQGKCTITHTLGSAPTAILLTPVVADNANSYLLSVVAGQVTATTYQVRARTSTGTNAKSLPIRFFYALYGGAVTPPPTSTTTKPPTTSVTPPSSPTPTGTPTSSTPTTPPSGGLSLARVDSDASGKWLFDGYYSTFTGASGWNSPNFFPVGVWYEAVTQQSDITKDKAAGLNTYVMLTGNTNMSLIRQNGMWALPSPGQAGVGSETVGWMLADEVELWGHEGNAVWTGNYPGQGDICQPASALCGYTILDTEDSRTPQNDGRLRYQNLGFGVDTYIGDAASAKFLDYTSASSIDRYWYTDNGICTNAGSSVPAAQCHVAASYGASVDRMRALAKQSAASTGQPVQPTYGFVEDGCPFGQFTTCITGPQIQGAVMSELIHEARGIIYFNHNFSGSCQSQHVLRESCGDAVRPYVTAINKLITDLAPALNSQSYAWTFNASVDTMLKRGPDGAYYVFAMTKRGAGTGFYDLNLPDGLKTPSKIEAVGESRTIAPVAGRFGDTFAAENTWHVYKITL